ncbi:MAG: CPBP family intramembrane metalloprotease [Solirubrobacteraceae bacterium]|nr:CPBP family intramembrane metalloprotease [Solirubrobacteraceae bacterium]
MTTPDFDPLQSDVRPPADPSRHPGVDDATRATVGAVLTYGAALLIGGLAALLSDPGAPGFRSAGSTRAQLAVQAVVFAAAALLLIESLRLMHRPGTRDPLANPAASPRVRPALAPVFALGLAAAVGAYLVGPLVSELLPSLTDKNPPVDKLGIDSALGSDLATVLVVAGLVPLGEELLFRGVLVGAWVRANRPVIAVLLSTVLFSAAHLTVGSRSVVVTALLGLLFAAAFMLSGSLGAPVLAHCTVNAIALVDAGLVGAVPLVVLAVTVLATTVVASRLSPLVSWRPPAGTLTE